MKSLARLFNFAGYKTKDVQVSTRDKFVRIDLERDNTKPFQCHRCGGFLGRKRGQHKLKIKHLSIMGFDTFIYFWRGKGHCSRCKKARSERVNFLSKATPHYTEQYAEWVGTMCEFAAVSRVAEFCDDGNMTIRRIDLERMQRMFKKYKIPKVTRIAVDEVYARKKPQKGENRNDRFFTIITDLNTRRVIWVSEGRSKKALDQFFIILGKRQCRDIKVVAMDQFEGYASSTKEYCKNAKIVWDRFHLMQRFEEVVNETRKDLHNELGNNDPSMPLSRGKYRFIFLKKSSRRTREEQSHIDQLSEDNRDFLHLEIIKEMMISFFDQQTVEDAKRVFDELTYIIWQAGFKHLKRWSDNFFSGWDIVKNFFEERVTSALAEGMNNVIKTLKRQAYGFRNMDYFRYKIMQVCGYLNSRYITLDP
jgi:transposase